MCYIFNCFGWTLDLLQRVITFLLACVMMCVMCFGMAVAIAAGIAYGYNYSMAEFLTFTKQNVTVYMRRGQFYDRPDYNPDVDLASRRSNDGVDLFGENKTLDYQDTNVRSDVQALPEAWKQMKDSRSYADVLSKYSGRRVEDKSMQEQEAPEARYVPMVSMITLLTRTANVIQYPASDTLPTERTSLESHSLSPMPTMQALYQTPPSVRTTILESGSTQIIMRKFTPLSRNTYPVTNTIKIDNLLYQESDYLPTERGGLGGKLDASGASVPPEPDIKIILEDSPKSRPYEPIRHWGTTVRRNLHKEYPERDEIDEDNVVYRPI